jgi:quercetin dioxygenase-like cupin family protein
LIMASEETTWPKDLDAMIAAGDHHELLLENEHVRVLDSWVKPDESTPVHTHEWPGVLYVIGFSDFVRRNDKGEVIFDSRESANKPSPGQAFWSGPLEPHSVMNVGGADIRIISVEIKPQGLQKGKEIF